MLVLFRGPFDSIPSVQTGGGTIHMQSGCHSRGARHIVRVRLVEEERSVPPDRIFFEGRGVWHRAIAKIRILYYPISELFFFEIVFMNYSAESDKAQRKKFDRPVAESASQRRLGDS